MQLLGRQSQQLLRELEGERICRLHRIMYRHQGGLDADDTPLEIVTANRVVLLDGAGDGQTLRVRDGEWHDPFAPPLSAENQDFVTNHGKWCRVDVSSEPGFAECIGQLITRVLALSDRFGTCAGVSLEIGDQKLWFTVAFDECHLSLSPPEGVAEVAWGRFD